MKNIILASIIGLCSLFANTLNAQWIKTNGPQGGVVNCIAKVQNKIWAGTRNGIFSSNNEGATWSKESFMADKSVLALYYSGDTIIMIYDSLYVDAYSNGTVTRSRTSFDGAVSWSQPSLVDVQTSMPILVRRIHDAIYLNDTKISRDFGQTWTNLVKPLNESYVSWLVSNSTVALTVLTNYTSNYTSLFRSVDDMQTWQLLDSTQDYYQTAYAKGNVILMSKGNQVLRSTDNANSFQHVFTMSGQYPYPYFGEKGGILYLGLSDSTTQFYRSTDDGLTWSTVSGIHYELVQPIPISNNDVLSIQNSTVVRNVAGSTVQVPCSTGIANNSISIIRSNKNVLFAGTSTNLYRSSDGGLSWYTSQRTLRLVSDMEFFGDTIFAAGQDTFYRSYDNGLTWQGLWNGYTMDGYTLAKKGDTLFIGEIYNGNRYTEDYGNTWHDMPQFPNASPSVEGGNVAVMNGILYAVSNGGTIFKYNFGSDTWAQLHEFWSTGAHNGNKLFVIDSVLIMSGRDELLISHDYGITWVTSPLTGMPDTTNFFGMVELLAYPRNITLYHGMWLASCGNYGVYKSTDEGITWQPLDAVPTPFAALNGFAVVNDILYAGTAWNSVWRRAAPFSNISGQVYIDANNNGIKDTAEQPMHNALVYTHTMGHTATTDTAGYYTLVTDAIADTMRVVLPNPYFTSAPQYYITSGADTGKDFGLYVSPSIVDISVELTNTTVFRPGFNTNLVIEAHNNGMNIQIPVVTLLLDSNVQYTGASPIPTSINGDTLIWQLNTMGFADQTQITVSATTHFSTTLGSAVACHAFITPVAGDTIPQNNASLLIDTVVGSYDPNDKQCSLGNKINPQQIEEGEEVVFTVRFQNTGNYQADFVRIADTISHFFDLSSFKVLSSSHPMHWSMQGLGIVNFHFDSIQLPPSSDDEPGSHGFVKYSVKCKQSASLGDAITNTAFIYFDFNAPIVTNTTTTVVTEPLTATGIPDVIWAKDLAIKVYPNPAWNKLNIDLSELGSAEKQIAIYSIAGELVYKTSTVELLSTVSIQNLNSGMYFGTVNNNGTIGKFKFIIEH